jgi:hypothetical protein
MISLLIMMELIENLQLHSINLSHQNIELLIIPLNSTSLLIIELRNNMYILLTSLLINY